MSFTMVYLLQEDVMRSLSDTRVNYPGIYNFALDTFDNRERYNIIYAKVKSGKRLVAETIAQYTNKGKSTLNFFFSGLNRKDIKVQIEELRDYQLSCYVSNEITKNKQHIIDQISHLALKGNEVIIHVDEADYGSDSSQILGSFINEIHRYENVTVFFYTATPFELTSARKFIDSAKVFKYIPSENYRGDEWFLKSNLVHSTDEDFVEFNADGKIQISETGLFWLNQWVSNPDKTKNFSVVRISTKTKDSCEGTSSKYKIFKKNCFNTKVKSLVQKQMNSIFPYKRFVPIFVDDQEAFHFGDYESWDGLKNSTLNRDANTYFLIVINQTSTRSTEWGFHENLFFYYSYESQKANITTQIQRQQRVAHYHEEGYPINVITSDVDTWLVSAGMMSIEDYVSLDPKNRSVHQRTSKTLDNKSNKERFFAFEGDEYVTVKEPTGKQQHYRLTISKDHPELVKRSGHECMKIEMSDGTIKDLSGQDLEFKWTNVCSRHGKNSDTANANVARYVLENKFGLSSAWHLCCALLDDSCKENRLNQDWTKDWDRLLIHEPRIKESIDNNLKAFAFYLPIMDYEKTFSIETKDKSVYKKMPEEKVVEA